MKTMQRCASGNTYPIFRTNEGAEFTLIANGEARGDLGQRYLLLFLDPNGYKIIPGHRAYLTGNTLIYAACLSAFIPTGASAELNGLSTYLKLSSGEVARIREMTAAGAI